MKKKRKINFPRIIWITGVFLILIVILLMVIDYKVNYEYLKKNTLYLYDCSGTVCTSQVDSGFSKDELFSKYECGYETCPEIKKVLDETYLILQKDKLNILYNYKTGKNICDTYEDYYVINEKYFIVTLNGYKGIIDKNNNILVSISYQDLGYLQNDALTGYSIDKIIAKKDDKYGIISIKTEEIIEKINHSEDDVKELINSIK